MKYKRTIILSVITIMLVTMIPLSVSAQSLVKYNVKVNINNGGVLYYNYGKNGRFFLSDDWETYPSSCKVISGASYGFTKLLKRGFIACPKSGYYFDGFYNQQGNKVNLSTTEMNILRVSVKGFYFYNYFPSKDNPTYSRLSNSAYDNQVKLYLKGIYGTTRYKIMDSVTLYHLPKKDAVYQAKFLKKEKPALRIPNTIVKTYGNRDFPLFNSVPGTLSCIYKSSNKKVVKIDANGIVSIKGPGAATVTCMIKESPTTLAAVLEGKVIVKPKPVSETKAKFTKNKTLSIRWNGSSKNSGYEIQISNNNSFKTTVAKKTVTSGKSKSATMQVKTKFFHNYVRIRPYKISQGQKIYGKYTVTKIHK